MSNVTRADLKDQVLRLLDAERSAQATTLHSKLDGGTISYQGLCRILRQLEAEGLAVKDGDRWLTMGWHRQREAEHKAFVERMERATAEREANFDAQALARLAQGPVRLSELKAIERDSTDGNARSDAWGLSDALGRLVEQGRAVKVRGVVSLAQEPKTIAQVIASEPDLREVQEQLDEAALRRAKTTAPELLDPEPFPEAEGDDEVAIWLSEARGFCPELLRTEAQRKMAVKVAKRWGLPAHPDMIRNCLDVANGFLSALVIEDAVIVKTPHQEPAPASIPQEEPAPVVDHRAAAIAYLRDVMEGSGDKRSAVPALDRWAQDPRAPKWVASWYAQLATFTLAVTYQLALEDHRASVVTADATSRRRERALMDVVSKALSLAAALEEAHTESEAAQDPPQDLPQEVSAPAQEVPQEPPALALEDVLVPSLPILKRCTSTARGSVCGVEAHTEDEVTSLFGWRWIGSADGGREVPQGQCKKCKAALNTKHGKARRSKPAAPDLRQGDMLNPLPPPPPRIDHFARLRSLSAEVVEGQHVGEGVTVARPPKLSPEDLERLTVAGEAFVFYLRQSALGAWGVTGQTFTPQGSKKQVLDRWARAAALIVVGLGMEVHELAHGPWACMEVATRQWAARLVASRTPTPDNPVANPVNVGPVESGKPVADRDRDRAPSGKRVTRGGRSAAIATGLPEVAREVRP